MSTTKVKASQKLGKILVENQIITEEQLKEALKRQYQHGGFLGTNLVQLGYLDEDTLLKILTSKLGIQAIHLAGHEITPELQATIPFEKVKLHCVLPVADEGSTLVVGMADPTDLKVQDDLQYTLRRPIRGVLAPETDIQEAIAFFEKEGYGTRTFVKTSSRAPSVAKQELSLRVMLQDAVEKHAEDLLITAGVSPSLKINNKVVRLQYPALTPGQVQELVYSILTDSQKEKLEKDRELDFAYSLLDVSRFRINIYKQRSSYSLAARNLMEQIPTLEELGLPEWLREFPLRQQGLILVTGPAGHGKSTTIASLVEIINTETYSNIITIEDPIEFLFQHKKSNINQREVGTDTQSFAHGLRQIFRQSPNVIVIGELRDFESISIALSAAETGHLVLGTLHTLNATNTIDRLINVFPGEHQNQVRAQLAESLLLILSQRLIPSANGKNRVLAYEKLVNTTRIKNLIRHSKSHLIRTQVSNGNSDFETIDASLVRLVRQNRVRYEEAMKYADNLAHFKELAQKTK
jgi:twitching motility protein PilT